MAAAAMLTPAAGADKEAAEAAADPKYPSPNSVLLPLDDASPAADGRRAGGTKRTAAAAAAAAMMDAEGTGQQQQGGGGWHKQARVGAKLEVTLPTGVAADAGPPSPSLLAAMVHPWAGMAHAGVSAAMAYPQLNPHQYLHPLPYANQAYLPLLQSMQYYQMQYMAGAAGMTAPQFPQFAVPPQADPAAAAAAHAAVLANAQAGAAGAGVAGGTGVKGEE